MKYFSHLLAAAVWLALLLPLAPAAAQSLSFDRVIASGSGDGPDGWGPMAQAFDAQGNHYVAGRFNGTIVLGSTLLTATQTPAGRVRPVDTYLAKLDAAGNYVWALQFGDGQASDVFDLAVDGAGNLYAAGSFESYSLRLGGAAPVLYNSSSFSEAFVAQFSAATGQLRWARRAGGTRRDYVAKLALNVAGEVYLVCQSGSPSVDFGATTLLNRYTGNYGYCAAYLAKLNTNGAWQWARPIGQGVANVSGLQPDAQGGLYVVGSLIDSLAFGATQLTTQRIAGTPSLYGNDIFVAKTTDAGAWLWAIQGDALTHQNVAYGGNLVLDGTGHLYVAGSYAYRTVRFGNIVLPNQSRVQPPYNPQAPPYPNYYYTDAFVSRVNGSTGVWEWAGRYGGDIDDGATFPLVDAQGRLYVAGDWLGGGWQLARIDPNTGAWLATQALPASGFIGFDKQNRLNLAGSIGVTPTTFGTLTLQPDGPNRGTGYLARLGALPLAARPTAGPAAGLQVWPNPAGGGAVWVQGPAAGQAVQVLDALGRAVARGQMPATGPLRLPLALPAGVYVVRAAGQARRLVIG